MYNTAIHPMFSMSFTRHWNFHSQISPYGSVDVLPYAAMGSGSVVAMSILENGYRDKLSRDEAVELLTQAIMSGIYNDLGSGSNVDICVIPVEGETEMLRNHKKLFGKLYERKFKENFPPGTTRACGNLFAACIGDFCLHVLFCIVGLV